MKKAAAKLGIPLILAVPALYFSYQYAVLIILIFVALYFIIYSEKV